MVFTREEQKKTGVVVKQAPALLSIHLKEINAYTRTRMHCTSSALKIVVLARDIRIVSVACQTTNGGTSSVAPCFNTSYVYLTRVGSASIYNEETLRDWADHLLVVAYDNQYLATCPVRAIEQYIRIGSAVGWDIIKGYMFITIMNGKERPAPRRGASRLSAAQRMKAMKSYAQAAGVRQEFILHSFRSGGAIAQALAGENLASIM